MGNGTETKRTSERMNCPVDNVPITAQTKEGLAIRFTEHCFFTHPGGIPEPANGIVREQFEDLKAKYQ